MKRSILYIIVSLGLVLTGHLPFASCDVGGLRPVEVLMVSTEGGVVLRTDTGDMGRGESWDAALENLKATAPGTVFEGTVSFLILDAGAKDLLPELLARQDLNPGCGVCCGNGQLDPEQAAAYLRAHEPDTDLRGLRAGREDVPVLLEKEGRLFLAKP